VRVGSRVGEGKRQKKTRAIRELLGEEAVGVKREKRTMVNSSPKGLLVRILVVPKKKD